ncbi:hypothetical protein COP2_003760 [Malus domestica]
MEHENDPSSKMRSRLENGLPNKAVIKSNHEPSFLVGSVFKIEHYWVVPNGPGSLGPVVVLIYHNKYNTIFVTKIQKYKPINADRFVLGLSGISQSIHRLVFPSDRRRKATKSQPYVVVFRVSNSWSAEFVVF